jgi:hypothetical protein
VEADELDQRPDLRLGAAQPDAAPVHAQAPRHHDQVEHERRVGEDQLRQVDAHVLLGADGPDQCPAAGALRGAVLVTGAAQYGRRVIKDDDPGNLLKSTGTCPANRSNVM